jgi:hypothetical protein
MKNNNEKTVREKTMRIEAMAAATPVEPGSGRFERRCA